MQERPGPWGVPPSGGVPVDGAPSVVPLLDVDPTAASDAHLAAAWAARDPLALGEVYRRFSPTLFGVAACLLDDRAVASDAVHDALVRAASRVGLLAPPARLAVWLLALVRAEASRHALEPSRTWTPRPALEPALWRTDDDGRAPGDPLWAAAAALTERDREVLELVARGVTDTRDLADVVGVSAQEAAVLTADMRVRLEASVGALLVARAGGDGCRPLGAVLGSQGPRWTDDVLALVVRHLQDCMDCRAVRSRLLAAAPVVPAGPRHVLLAADLRPRLVQTLGTDGSAATTADRSTSWLVEAGTAGVGGWRWGWLDNGFPGRPPGPVRRVADVVAELEAAAAAQAAPPPAPASRRRVPLAAAALLLGLPVVLGGVLVVAHPFGGSPGGGSSASGGVLPGAVGSGGAGAGTARPSGAPGSPGAGKTGVATGGASGGRTTSGSGGASSVADGASPGTTDGSSVPVAGGSAGGAAGSSGVPQPGGSTEPDGSEGGSSSSSGGAGSSSTSPAEPAEAPVITSASASPATVTTPGGSECKPLRSTVTVTVAHASGATGSVTWSNGRATITTPLTGTGGTMSASVGPFHVAGSYSLTVKVSGPGGSDSTTVPVDVTACGKD